mmetsp:Transcript_117544/g.226800  ORF Transcript_117544/g.226800 Transcript_117544/m.226800 type:complete len:260 (-) Transcript_117544:536-1315(-)
MANFFVSDKDGSVLHALLPPADVDSRLLTGSLGSKASQCFVKLVLVVLQRQRLQEKGLGEDHQSDQLRLWKSNVIRHEDIARAQGIPTQHCECSCLRAKFINANPDVNTALQDQSATITLLLLLIKQIQFVRLLLSQRCNTFTFLHPCLCHQPLDCLEGQLQPSAWSEEGSLKICRDCVHFVSGESLPARSPERMKSTKIECLLFSAVKDLHAPVNVLVDISLVDDVFLQDLLDDVFQSHDTSIFKVRVGVRRGVHLAH